MNLPAPVEAFVERLRVHDGDAPFSEAKVTALAVADRYVTVEENGVVVAVGVVAEHRQPSGDVHLSIETAVEPSMRFAEFESVVLDQTLDLVPRAAEVTVWSRRASLDRALERAGFQPERSLAHMRVPLPLAHDIGNGESIRHMRDDDDATLITINAAAFSEHREAASLDMAELEVLSTHPWFDRAGVLFHEAEDSTVDAFCWTKVDDDGVGEIYRIGVAPAGRGQGLGRTMVIAGFGHLAGDRGCSIGSLWVDEANRPAVGLYTSLGMEIVSRNREFRRT